MIAIACASCQKKLAVKDDLAGKKVKCPVCGHVTAVPMQSAGAKVSANAGSEELRTVAQESKPELPAIAPPPSPDASNTPTNPSLSRPDATHGVKPDAGHDAGLTDFLAPPQADDELGRLGDFRILKILGHGGMGVVFLGEDATLRRKVAIKAMLPHLAQSRSSQQRFLREARSAATLEHDHIVAIHHVGVDRGAPYIVMPFLKGEPLDERLKHAEEIPLAEVLRIGREIAEALAAAHAVGLVHRDIKPANVWLEAPRNRVKILDFGLARAVAEDSELTQQGAVVGTPAYMAPEQGRGEHVDARSDLWSLGVVLYRMCTGEMPFKGANALSTLRALEMTNPPPPAQVNAEVPAELSDLVTRLLEKDPAKRMATAAEVVTAISAIEQQSAASRTQSAAITLAPPARPTGEVTAEISSLKTQPVITAPRRRLPWLGGVGAALAAFCLLLVAGGIVYRFTFATGDGTLLVEVDKDADVRFKNGKLEIRDPKTGQLLYTLAPSERNRKLPPGEYLIDVVGADGLLLSTKKFTLTRNGDASVQVSIAPPALAQKAPEAGPQYALNFDSNGTIWSSVQIRDLVVDFSRPCTMEGYVTARSEKGTGHPFLCDGAAAVGGQSGAWHLGFWAEDPNGKRKSTTETGAVRVAIGKKTHLALVYTGRQFRLYVDGTLSVKKDVGDLSLEKIKIFFTLGRNFTGEITEVRVSKIARYDKDFTPAQRFEPDADTLALYHFDEGAGDVLKDSSGNAHHGKIVGAKWVKADGSPIAPPLASTQYALKFTENDTVEVPSLTYDKTATYTIEAYVTRGQVKVSGSASALGFDRFALFDRVPGSKSTIERGWFFGHTSGRRDQCIGPAPLVTNRRIHLAGVRIGKTHRLFADGKLIDSQAMNTYGEAGTGFMIGQKFEGIVGEVRISKSAHYDKDFTPAERFEPDADTLALYHFDEGSGDVLKDSSGNGHHGKIVGARWVKADGSPAFALRFDFEAGQKSESLQLPSLHLPVNGPVSIEGFVKVDGGNAGPNPHLFGTDHQFDIGAYPNLNWYVDGADKKLNQLALKAKKPLTPGVWHHLAGVRDGKEHRLYVDGVLQDKIAMTLPLTLPLRKSASPFFIGYMCKGVSIRAVRASKVARYDKDFTPAQRFEPDADTLALYHFDEGSGDVLKDSSGNNHHGKIVGAKWVKADEAPPPLAKALLPPLAIAPFDATQARAHQEAWAKHLGVPVEFTNKLGMKFQLIPPGEFTMGASKDELPDMFQKPGHLGERAGPAHRVRLTKPYYIGEREVRFADFALLMKDQLGKVVGKPDGPVVQYCNWLQCVEFCNRLSEREGLTPAYAIDGKQVAIVAGAGGYRLPTEAEWEFACRGGTTTLWYFGMTGADLDKDFKAAGKRLGKDRHLVNPFGLFDMYASSSEYCWDWYDLDYYRKCAGKGLVIDPLGADKGDKRVIRGGSNFASGGADLKLINSADRIPCAPDSDNAAPFGFGRVVLPVSAGPSKPSPATAPPLAIVPFDAKKAGEYQQLWANHSGRPVEETNKIGMKLRLIPPGDGVAKAFYLGKYEVTQAEWENVMGYNLSSFGPKNKLVVGLDTSKFPVETVSWYDSVEFCNKLSEREGMKPYYDLTVAKRGGKDGKQIEEAEVKILGGSGYHIPTDAEWEHGCRAGTKTKYHFGDKDEELLEYAWFDKNSDGRPHAVGEKKPNAFGLYDMHGNVREWNEEMLTNATPGAPERVSRGGLWNSAAGNCAVSTRARLGPAHRTDASGLRVARVP